MLYDTVMKYGTIPARVNSWTLLRHISGTPRKTAMWLMRCDCGTERNVRLLNVLRGGSRNCGCVRKIKNHQRQFRHGRRNTLEYNSWASMMDRCNNPNVKQWMDYGGRGISVCERWKDFRNFLEDMGLRPTVDHSLGRIDNNKGYFKENCRWETKAEQASNTRYNKRINFNGKTMTLSQLAREIGEAPQTLTKRFKRGWSVEKTLTVPTPP